MPLMGAGNHEVTITGHGLSEAATGTPQIWIAFQNEAGQHINAYLAITENTWEFASKKLEAAGFRAQDHGMDFTKLNGSDMLVGNRCSIVVELRQKPGSDELQPQVSWINKLGGGQQPATEEQAKLLNLKIQKAIGMQAAAVTNADGGVPF